jgi:cation diffusion facilitator family transporter
MRGRAARRAGDGGARPGDGAGHDARARHGVRARVLNTPWIAPDAVTGSTKFGAARLSVISNTTLIALKVVAGAVTGSIAIITEAVHSCIDLLASIVAYLSLRKADEPADAEHQYGHAKAENLAAAIEGMLILVGAGVIVYEASRRLTAGGELQNLGFGIAVIAISAVVNLAVSTYLYRQARAHDSPALEGDAAHLRADAATSGAVLVGLVLIQVTGFEQIDAIFALAVASAIVYTGVRILTRSSRVLMDEALPQDELDVVRKLIADHPAPELEGFHKLRGRRAGSLRHIDLHLQFVPGTSLERAHDIAHELQAGVRDRMPSADLLVHIEPSRRTEAGARQAREEGRPPPAERPLPGERPVRGAG